MKRFFGGKKEAPPPPPSLGDASETVQKRVGVLDDKIRALDKQLVDFKNQIKATRPGPAQNRIKQRALQVLKQKRMYEQQRDQVRPSSSVLVVADLIRRKPLKRSCGTLAVLCVRTRFWGC
jgi:charged multivesicular body protein 5